MLHKTEQEVTSAEEENESEESSDEETERVTKVTPKDDAEMAYYKFAYKRMKQEADAKNVKAAKKPVVSQHYAVPG
ncbi:hypothetical protein AAVH_18218 [Aphelenchoides avenae]|nr:hypothetical protein AAVH_18218 [Aphelenchus avenae]